MRTVDFLKRYVLYHLLMVLLFVAGYWLLTGFAPKSSLHTVIQYAIGPLVLVIYTLLSYRFLATVPATAGALKRLYVITGVPLLMGSFILYSIAGYYTDPDPGIIDGEAVIRSYGIPTIDEARALALVRDFNAAFGYCSDASPKLQQSYGCRVTIGNEYKTHAEYTIDPKREVIRSFEMVYDRQAAAPLPAAPVSSDLTEVVRRIHQELALPGAAVQGDQAAVAGIQNDLNQLFSNQGRDQGQEASRRFVWQKEYQGIPYFFNQIVMGFDPAHRLTYYYNDWTEDRRHPDRYGNNHHSGTGRCRRPGIHRENLRFRVFSAD